MKSVASKSMVVTFKGLMISGNERYPNGFICDLTLKVDILESTSPRCFL
jgi:hypothetical protein